jgi:hypothetical protein
MTSETSEQVRRRALKERRGGSDSKAKQVQDAVEFARGLLDRTATTAASDKEFFRYSDWKPLDMAKLRDAESLMYKNPVTNSLLRLILDAVVSKGLRILEYEHMYDGSRQQQWQQFLDSSFTELAKRGVCQALCASYTSVIAVPHAQHGFQPRTLSISHTRHEIRASATDTHFRYRLEGAIDMQTLSGGDSGGGGGGGFTEATSVAYALGPDGKEPRDNAIDMFLAPEAHGGHVFRAKPRIMTFVFESPPTHHNGVSEWRSRMFSLIDAMRDAEFFNKNAKDAERQNRDRVFYVSSPPLPPPNPAAQLGAAAGAAAAAELCPSGIGYRDALRSSLQTGGMLDEKYPVVSDPSLFSTSTQENLTRGALNALKGADDAWFGRNKSSGQMSYEDFRHMTGGMIKPSKLKERFREKGGPTLIPLKPGQKLENLPAAPPHDDFVRVSQAWFVDLACNAFGVPRMLYEHSATNHAKTAAVGENDPANKTFRAMIDRLTLFVTNMCREVYRQCYLMEAAARFSQRPFTPGPLAIQEEETKQFMKKETRLRSSNQMKEHLQEAVRRNALRAKIEGEREDMSRITQTYAAAASAGGSAGGSTGVYDTLPAFKAPRSEIRKLLAQLARSLREVTTNSSVSHVANTLKSLFGMSTPIADPEALIKAVHDAEDDEDGSADYRVKQTLQERIRMQCIDVSYLSRTQFAQIAFVEREGYLKPGVYALACAKELGLSISDFYATPHFPESDADKKVKIESKNMSRQLKEITRLISAGPTTKKDGTPNMPLVNANKVKRPDDAKKKKTTTTTQKKRKAPAESEKKKPEQKKASAAAVTAVTTVSGARKDAWIANKRIAVAAVAAKKTREGEETPGADEDDDDDNDDGGDGAEDDEEEGEDDTQPGTAIQWERAPKRVRSA